MRKAARDPAVGCRHSEESKDQSRTGALIFLDTNVISETLRKMWRIAPRQVSNSFVSGTSDLPREEPYQSRLHRLLPTFPINFRNNDDVFSKKQTLSSECSFDLLG